MGKENKNSATEDELGYIHKGINRIFSHQQRRILEMIEEEDFDALAVVDPKLMTAMMNWVKQNDIGYKLSESEEKDLFKEQLKNIQNKANKATARLRVVGDE